MIFLDFTRFSDFHRPTERTRGARVGEKFLLQRRSDVDSFAILILSRADMSLEKFKLLCWKNFTLQKRHPIAGLFEILFPVLIVLLFTFARNNVDRQTHHEMTFTEFKPIDYSSCKTWSNDKFKTVGISPRSGPLLKLIDDTDMSKVWNVETFESASDLSDWLHNENDTVAGIEFDEATAVSLITTLIASEPNDTRHFNYRTRRQVCRRNSSTRFVCRTTRR